MEAITNPKTEYMLEARLDVLHYDSRKWISELEFMKNELQFFIKLLNSKVFEDAKEQQRQHIYNNMNNLSSAIVAELEQEVKSHERKLAELLSAKSSNDAAFREQHKELHKKMNQVDNDVKTLKMLVFGFVDNLK